VHVAEIDPFTLEVILGDLAATYRSPRRFTNSYSFIASRRRAYHTRRLAIIRRRKMHHRALIDPSLTYTIASYPALPDFEGFSAYFTSFDLDSLQATGVIPHSYPLSLLLRDSSLIPVPSLQNAFDDLI
jgi:hypothetical protein